MGLISKLIDIKNNAPETDEDKPELNIATAQ